MSEFDELVASPGVLMAGRFGADGRVAEHKTMGLHIETLFRYRPLQCGPAPARPSCSAPISLAR
jgi:hypothetical protein